MNKAMYNAQGSIDEIVQESYFGVCPECGSAGTLINVARAHWCVCYTHKIAWWVGSNLFSAWTTKDPAVWRTNNYLLTTCRLIQASAAVYDATAEGEYGHFVWLSRWQRGLQAGYRWLRRILNYRNVDLFCKYIHVSKPT
ncbi:MAG: hypothetical protein NT075_06915 [Chloroflexi bacterium]|nr:hypothetical protein [Chloroflexota bacterium]